MLKTLDAALLVRRSFFLTSLGEAGSSTTAESTLLSLESCTSAAMAYVSGEKRVWRRRCESYTDGCVICSSQERNCSCAKEEKKLTEGEGRAGRRGEVCWSRLSLLRSHDMPRQ